MSNNRISLNGRLPQQPPTLEERHRQTDAALAERYDALNQRFADAEKRLRALKPIHPVWVECIHFVEGEVELLGLMIHQGKWRLCHASDHAMNHQGDIYDIKPIVECPVEERVRAAARVKSLHEKIIESKEKYIPKVQEAITQLDDYCHFSD